MWWFGEKIKESNKGKIALVILILAVGKVIANRNDLSGLGLGDLFEVFLQLPILAFLAGVISQKIFRLFFKEEKGHHTTHLIGHTLKEREDKADDEVLNFAIFWCVVGYLVFCF